MLAYAVHVPRQLFDHVKETFDGVRNSATGPPIELAALTLISI
jgi:hypothetical protein